MYMRNVPLTDAILQHAHDYNWEIIDTRFFGSDLEGEHEFQADGILSSRDMPLAVFKSLTPSVVYVGHRAWFKRDEQVGVVEADHVQVGRLGAEHFLERGFQHVSGINTPVGGKHASGKIADPTVEVGLGLDRRLKEGGIRCLDPLLLPDEGYRRGRQRFQAWLAHVPRPVGLLVWQDRRAAEVCGWCRDLGVAVPEEVAVLGIDNKVQLCNLSPRPLSSIDTDYAAQGREAARLLQRMMEGKQTPSALVQVQPSGVVTRKSTDILAIPDVAVAKAISFIWEHMGEPISAEDVAGMSGFSRSTLDRRFRKHLGRSINEEMLRKRLELCRELLLSTDLTMVDIAPRVGLLSKNYLHRAFRKRFGCSPKEFRQSAVRG